MSAASATASSTASAGRRRAGRTAAFTALFRALTRRGGPGPAERVKALPSMLGDAWRGSYPHLGRGRLAMFVLALAYLVSPVDVVPEALLAVFGLGDDAVLAMWLGGALLVESDRYLGWRREHPTVIDGAVTRPVRGQAVQVRRT